MLHNTHCQKCTGEIQSRHRSSSQHFIPIHIHKFKTLAKLKKSDTRLTTYSNDELCVKGKASLNCEGRVVKFYIADTQQTLILGLNASQELGIIKNILNVNSLNQCLIQKYPKLFKGLRYLKVPYKIKLDTTVTVPPVVVPTKNQPALLRDHLRVT